MNNVLYIQEGVRRGAIAITALFAAFLFLAGAQTAFAENPVGCYSNGVGLSIAVYRADGVTPVAGGSVEPGETIQYEAVLNHLGGTNCYFDGGQLDIVTPDGTHHTVASGAGIPLVTTAFTAPQQSYVVSEADLSGLFLEADAIYTGGTSYTPTIEQEADASVDISTLYQDVALQVQKTAVPAAETGFRWTIDKSVYPETLDLFVGDSASTEYTIVVDKVPVGTSYSVSGTITINNPAQFAAAEGVDVVDSIAGFGVAAVDCGVALPTTIPAGGQLVCTYDEDLGSDNTPRTNTATVTTTGDVDGGSDDADYDPSTATPVDNSGTLHVDDTFDEGDKDGITDDITYTYTKVFTCDEDEGQNDNTADLLDEQDALVDTDDAAVQVNCYDLEVEKTGVGTYDLEWEWDIEKTGSATDLLLQAGEIYLVDYEVTVDTVGSTETNQMIEGDITITNNHPTMDADIVSVVDTLATVNCPSDVVPANDSIVCTYGPVSSDADTNDVTVTQQNYDYDKDGVSSAGGTTDYEADTDIDFTMENEYDECIDVNDTTAGFLGTVCADDSLPATFNYQVEFSTEPDTTNDILDVVLECGENEHENIADFVTNDTAATGADSWIVTPEVQCATGCTLTQGYWKTHSEYGPAPYDQEGWSVILDEADETFFQSGQSWYEAFWTPPAGNKYYNLAHQYMAAKLNILNDASAPSEVEDAIASAEDFFANNTTELFSYAKQNKKGKDVGKKELLIDEGLYANLTTWAGILGAFNEGDIGPGHCDEDSTSNNGY